jgi:aldehyde dehydrogenase family 7 protein A1
MLALRLQSKRFGSQHRRALSTQASSILSALNLPTDGSPIPGVYNTKWTGSGELGLVLLCWDSAEADSELFTAIL